ncbi:ArnT family glycosyltransferase [Persicobacter diffluens]|uniref:Glycosyltransferase RgtA/B/C/D-like domain-containing protein n=1 Tax=Persicobacter diffluens TaxID=981 RepID=A0AAN4VXX3_9BACT|nr:hypothetical protein PEDI_13770 [Persicobacter diffluens]
MSLFDKSNTRSQGLLIFLVAWLIINLLQAWAVGVHEDEAYYWMWSRWMDWGYFDHPPMVALIIKIGKGFFSGTLGLRLMTVLMSTTAIYLLWELVQPYQVKFAHFCMVVASVPLIHIYGFVTTPDVPLFFFGVLYFHALKRYYQEDSWKNVLLLAIVIALMFYSKYHAVLLVFFSLLANWKLLTRPSFWVTAVLSVLLLTPHIYWQISNEFPSIQYHLFDRSKEPYKIANTYMYLLNEWVVFGPLTAYFLFKAALKVKLEGDFDRALLVNLFGIVLFFFISSFKGWVEAHWTLVATIPLVLLAPRGIQYLSVGEYKWFKNLFVVSLVLLMTARLLLAIPAGPWYSLPALKMFKEREEWSERIQEVAQGRPVVFVNGFQKPSQFGFYTDGAPVACLTQVNYRKHQYDLWPMLDSLQGKSIALVGYEGQLPQMQSFDTPNGKVSVGIMDDFQSLGKIWSEIQSPAPTYSAGQEVKLEVLLTNKFDRAVQYHLDLEGASPALLPTFWKEGKIVPVAQQPIPLEQLNWRQGEQRLQSVHIKMPAEAGKYKLMISTCQSPFERRLSGRAIDVEIK